MTESRAVVRLQRTFQASPDRVYRAWLAPEVMTRGRSPGGVTAPRVEVDERVGGRYRVWHESEDGETLGGFESEFVELVPGERIVFLWRFVGPERDFDSAQDSRLTITFREVPGGATEVTLVHERLDAIDVARPGFADGGNTGWGQALDKLAGALADAA